MSLPTLSVLTATCGAVEITERWFLETLGSCAVNHEVVVVAQAETDDERERLLSSCSYFQEAHGWRCARVVVPEPLGSARAFNLGLAHCSGDVVAMLHNDLMVHQPDWDTMVLEWFAEHPDAGVVGFHGSRELGHPLLYRIPYELQQLARGDNHSNLEDAEAHGARSVEPVEVVTLDGMALIARRTDLAAWGGLDERYTHHMVDHDLCLTARQCGRRNHMLPISARHVSGQTANASRYNDHLRANGRPGGDAEVHREAHESFYAKWRGTGILPARIG